MPEPIGLELELDTAGDLRVGAVLYGTVTVVREVTGARHEPVALCVELEHITHGPGGSSSTLAHREVLLEGGSLPDGRYPFRVRMPPGPLSWHGRQMTLAWTVRAVAERGQQRIAAEHSVELLGALADPTAPDAATVERWSLDPLLACLATAPELGGMALAEAARDLPDVVAGLLGDEGTFERDGWSLQWTRGQVALTGVGGACVLPTTDGYALQLNLARQLVVREVFGRVVEATHRLVVTLTHGEARALWLVCPSVRDDRLLTGLPYMPVHAHGDAPLLPLALLARLVLVVRAAGGRLARWRSELEMVPPELTAALRVAPRHGGLVAARDIAARRRALLAWPDAVRAGVHELAERLERVVAQAPVEPPPMSRSTVGRLLGVLRPGRRVARVEQRVAARGLSVEEAPGWLSMGESFVCLFGLRSRPDAVPGYWRLELVEACRVDGAPRITRRVFDDGPVEWRRLADGRRRVVIASRIPVRAAATASGPDWHVSWRVALYVERDGEDVLYFERELIVLPVCCS